jgi:cytochrome c oxidase subunit 2
MVDRRRRAIALTLAVAGSLSIGAVLAACGGSDGPKVTLSAAGKRGKAIADTRGCVSCHSAGTDTRVGPGWAGLAGSTVTLDDGTKVTADDAYLRKAITDARSEVVKGFNNLMPTYRNIPANELADLIAYLHDLAPETAESS